MAALERQRKRRASIRRTITIVVLVGIAVGIYVAVSSGKKKVPTSTSSSGDTQTAVDAVAAKAGCPSSPTQALNKPSWSTAPAMSINPAATYTATVKTDVGTFKIALDAKDAPQTVNSFVFLADHGFFNCEAFMRVIPGFMEQTGSPNQTNGGTHSGPGYEFANENIPTNGYSAGDVAMANSGANTNGSQFFILAGSYSTDSYSLFGKVTSGLSVVKKINADGNSSPSSNGVPPKIVHRMLKVTISSS
jgi:cyclophilin family peptidyl-prolyl cis-trans isomerase